MFPFLKITFNYFVVANAIHTKPLLGTVGLSKPFDDKSLLLGSSFTEMMNSGGRVHALGFLKSNKSSGKTSSSSSTSNEGRSLEKLLSSLFSTVSLNFF